MSLRAGMLGLALLAALAGRAGEQGAPLEKSKEELKALRKDPGAQGAEAALAKLRDAMPHMQSPVSAAAPVDSTPRQNSETGLKKKRDAQKNWLLDGMDKLEKNTRSKSGDARGSRTETRNDNEQPDLNDPEYILNVYSEQQKNDEVKAAAKHSTAVRSDPLAPFLQGWLADSPVRGKFFDEYVRKPDAVTVSDGTAARAQTESNADPGLSGLNAGGLGSRTGTSGAAPAQGNPYLQGFDASVLPDAGDRNRLLAGIPVFQAGGTSPPGSLAEPGPAAQPPDKKALLPALPDDKKYFPQLKKF